MNKRIYSVGLLTMMACSSGAGGAAARPAVARATHSQPQAALTKNETARAPLEYQGENDSDLVFIENAERAIAEYTAFLARAGTNEEYAATVKRSREQIEDLRAAIDFVRAGSAQRAAH